MNIKITKNDTRSLEIKAGLAYKMLKQAVEANDFSLISSAECLYTHDLGEYLSRLTEKAVVGIPSLRKGGKRSRPLEKFILQYLLMHKIPSEYDNGNYQTSLTLNTDDNMGGLMVYLDARDEPNFQKSEIFKLIQNRAADLRKQGRYDLILNALDYIREKYN